MPTTAEPLLETRKGAVWLATTGPPFEFVSPFGGEDFALMVVVADANISTNDQTDLSDAFVAQGCRYAVCAGHDCSSWDDSIDWAFISTDPNYDPPDDRFVMTTWHDHEPLSDTAWFFLWNNDFDDFVPNRFVALVIGGDATSKRDVETVLRVAAADGVGA